MEFTRFGGGHFFKGENYSCEPSFLTFAPNPQKAPGEMSAPPLIPLFKCTYRDPLRAFFLQAFHGGAPHGSNFVVASSREALGLWNSDDGQRGGRCKNEMIFTHTTTEKYNYNTTGRGEIKGRLEIESTGGGVF